MENITRKFEYVLWGIPPRQSDETLLLAKVDGEAITDLNAAETFKKVLQEKHKCTSVRIQTIDLTDNKINFF